MAEQPVIITISRQLGCGGSLLGQQLSEQLGILYLDRQIVKEAAKKLDILEQHFEFRDEKKTSFWQSVLLSAATYSSGVYTPPDINIPSDQRLFKAESEVIQEVAKKHSAVIIGRGSFYLLKNHPQYFSVFCHASMDFRQQRIEKFYNLSAAEAQKFIKKNDQERSSYLLALTGQNWLNANNYHLSIDTGIMGFEQAKDTILSCVYSRFPQLKKNEL